MIILKSWFHRYSHKDNLDLTNNTGEDAVIESLKLFKNAGGGCIVENSTFGMNRKTKSLKRISIESGVHVIAGTGKWLSNYKKVFIKITFI